MQIVLLDAQILIALDPDTKMEEVERSAAIEMLRSIRNDPSKKIAITPLLRYEVMCGIKNPEIFKAIDDFLTDAEVFDVTDKDAYCAIKIYQEARRKTIELKNPTEPKKHKFDLLHVASADVNSLHFESRDKGVEKMKKLLTNLRETDNA